VGRESVSFALGEKLNAGRKKTLLMFRKNKKILTNEKEQNMRNLRKGRGPPYLPKKRDKDSKNLPY